MADSLLESKLTNDQLESAQIIYSSANDLLRQIDRILEFTHHGTTKNTNNGRSFDIRALLSEVTHHFDGAARAKGLNLQTDADRNLPPRVRGDSDRLRLILTNLVSNAITYTREGHIHASLSVRSRSDDGESFELLLRVSDTGIGMTDEQIHEAFNPFGGEQGGSLANKSLGLALCKNATDLLNGSIHIESSAGRSTRVSVILPLRSAPDIGSSEEIRRPQLDGITAPRRNKRKHSSEIFTPVRPLSPSQPITSRVEPSSPAIPNSPETPPLGLVTKSGTFQLCRMLVVEDDIINQKVICTLLQRPDISIDVANNGRIALNRVKRRYYDCILMDFHMPVLDGPQTTQEIRQFEKESSQKRSPIIALTAETDKEQQQVCLDSGMDYILTKPVNKNELWDAIRKFVNIVD